MNNYDTELMEMIKIKDHIIKGYEDNINFYHSRINELQERIDKAIEIINDMISKGYIIKNGETSTYYQSTGYHSEFGIRAPIILDVLKGIEDDE